MSGYFERISDEIADILLGEGIDHTQAKAALAKAGLQLHIVEIRP